MADGLSSGMREGLRPFDAVVLVLCGLGVVLHQATHLHWFIEDAAICFAYARNLATGEGAVPFPGGERIEAFSDPTWIAVLTAFQALGLDGFTVAKPLAMAFSVLTLPIVWWLAREALPEHRGPGALVAPILLTASAQQAIWSASGLENALFGLLLGLALLRTVRESASGGFPWGAAAWLLLVWTRPEGVLYAAVGFGWYAWATLRAGRGWRPLAAWVGVVGVPSVALEAARIAYFAWPLPNTWYAKVVSRGVPWLDWSSRGWNQLRDWADRLWQGYAVPVYVLGLAGTRGRRAALGLAVVAALGASLLWPGTRELRRLAWWPALPDPPEAFASARIVLFVAAGALLPLLGLGRPGGLARSSCGHAMFVGLLFSIVADGDWMGAYRWMGLVTVPGSVLLAVGMVELADAVERRVSGAARWKEAGWVAIALLTAMAFPPNLSQTRDHVYWNRDVTPAAIALRVDHTRALARRAFHTERIVNVDIDQGAFLWWAPDYRQHDIGKLVDVPMARHWFQQRAFVREYVFEEVDPTFANVSLNGFWAHHTGLPYYPEWDERYFHAPSYTTLEGQRFVGLYARRDLVMAERWDGPALRVEFAGGFALEGLSLPAPWTPGRDGYLEAPVSTHVPRAQGEEARMIAFLARDGRVAAFDLELGYGMYPLDWWKPGEVFRGRHAVRVPDDLPPGRYDLGFVLLGPDGRVLPAESAPEGAVLDRPVYAAGEVRFEGVVEVVAGSAFAPRVEAARAEIAPLVASGACEEAERAWVRLLRHRPRDWAWQDEERRAVAPGFAACWAGRAEDQPAEAPGLLERAHDWDHWSPELERVGEPVAERLLAEGAAARRSRDWERAWAAYRDVLRFQPWRAWARRYAEEARDQRLGIANDTRIGVGGEDDRRAVEGKPRGKAIVR